MEMLVILGTQVDLNSIVSTKIQLLEANQARLTPLERANEDQHQGDMANYKFTAAEVKRVIDESPVFKTKLNK